MTPARLGPLESRVMDALWDHGPLTVRGVIDQLDGIPAYTTIATVLSNLQRKQLVTSHKDNHSTRYTPLIGREEQVASLMSHALDTSRDRAASMLHFVESINDSDLELLRQHLLKRDDGGRP